MSGTALALMATVLSPTAQGQTAIIGTGTTQTGGTGTVGNPVSGYYMSQRFQTVYTAAELATAGIPANSTITGLGFSVYRTMVGSIS